MATKQKEIKRLNLPIEGMTCASCVFHVEGALNGVAGVTNATVNLATEKAVVEIEGPDVPVERLVEAVSQAGYKIPHATMTLNIGGMTCASCVFHVESALAKVDGVSEATVNLATEKATVKYVAAPPVRRISQQRWRTPVTGWKASTSGSVTAVKNWTGWPR